MKKSTLFEKQSFCFTGVDKLKRLEYTKLIQDNGGLVSDKFTEKCTILLGRKAQSEKYQHACLLDIPILTLEWVRDSVDQQRQLEHQKYLLKPLAGLIVSATGKNEYLKAQLREQCEEMGATFIENFHKGCSHLIVVSDEITGSNKRMYAKSWGIPIVQPEWVYECYKKGFAYLYNHLVSSQKDTASQQHSQPLSLDTVKTNTERTLESTYGADLTMEVEKSQISSSLNLNSQDVGDLFNVFEDKCFHALEFKNPIDMADITLYIAKMGGMKSPILKNVNYLVCAENTMFEEEELNCIMTNNPSLEIVTLKWLKSCFSCRTVLPIEAFSTQIVNRKKLIENSGDKKRKTESLTNEKKPPKEVKKFDVNILNMYKKPPSGQSVPVTPPITFPKIESAPIERKIESVKLSQPKEEPKIENRIVNTPIVNPFQKQLIENEKQRKLTPEKTPIKSRSKQIADLQEDLEDVDLNFTDVDIMHHLNAPVFENLEFVYHSTFPVKDKSTWTTKIEENGGKIVSSVASKTRTIFSARSPRLLTSGINVTTYWIDECIKNNLLMDLSKCPLYKPIFVTNTARKVVITTGIHGEEKAICKTLVTVLNGVWAERMTTSTDFLVKVGDDASNAAKINLAVENKIPVVSLQWLFDCGDAGRFLDPPRVLSVSKPQKYEIEPFSEHQEIFVEPLSPEPSFPSSRLVPIIEEQKKDLPPIPKHTRPPPMEERIAKPRKHEILESPVTPSESSEFKFDSKSESLNEKSNDSGSSSNSNPPQALLQDTNAFEKEIRKLLETKSEGNVTTKLIDRTPAVRKSRKKFTDTKNLKFAFTKDITLENEQEEELVVNPNVRVQRREVPVESQIGESQVIKYDSRDSRGLIQSKEKIILLSGISEPQYLKYRDQCENMGARVYHEMPDSDNFTFTHLIAPLPQRSAKVLAAIAARKPMLRGEFLDESIAAGKWLPETAFEWTKEELDKSPHKKSINRVVVEAYQAQRHRPQPFLGVHVAVIGPKGKEITSILRFGGAHIVDIENEEEVMKLEYIFCEREQVKQPHVLRRYKHLQLTNPTLVMKDNDFVCEVLMNGLIVERKDE